MLASDIIDRVSPQLAYYRRQMADPATRAAYRERRVRHALIAQRKKMAFLAAYKLERGCIDCGYRDHAVALDFDHVSGKKDFALSRAYGKSWKRILAELEKCEVRCANCHRVKTAERKSLAG